MPNQTTLILRRLADGEDAAMDQLIPHVYDELKRIAKQHLAGQQNGNVLQATALVHEAYLRLIDQRDARWQDRSHFLAIASTLMRRIVLDHVRSRRAAKRGGMQSRLQLDTFSALSDSKEPIDIVALDDLLTDLSRLDPRHAQVVEMRFFGGLTIKDVAEVLKVSESTVKDDWRSAKAWLAVELAS